MASSSHSVSASRAVIPYQPLVVAPETIAHEVFRRSWETARYEISRLNPEIPLAERRLSPFLPRPTGAFPVGHTHFTLVPGQYHEGDKQIGIEIYAPIHAPAQGLPLIIFSHGFSALSTDYRHLVEEIASHGFNVVCLNHPSSSCYSPILQEEDEMERSAPEKVPAIMEMLAQRQVANIGFVLETLRDSSCVRASDTVVLAGHSLGGAASILAARSHPSISACVNLDGGLVGSDETKTAGLTIPMLTLRSDFDLSDPYLVRFYNEWVAFHANSSPYSHFETIPNIGHMDFMISSFNDEEGVDAGIAALVTTSQKILQLMHRVHTHPQSE